MCRRSLLVRGLLVLCLLVSVARTAHAQPVINQGSNLGTFGIGYLEQAFSATGGTGPYTWEVAGGALPPGTSLRSDLWFATTVYTATVSGMTTAPGTYNFSLRVTSGGLSSTRAFTIKISLFILREQYTYIPDGFKGQPYPPYSLKALNNAGPVSFTVSGTMPAGMALSSTGVVSGTPTASAFNFFNFTMTDGVDTLFKTVYLQVYDIAVTTPGPLPTATQNVPYSTAIDVVGGTPPYAFTTCSGCLPPQNASSGLPSGLTIDETTGTISGTPTFATQGNFTLTVTDANHLFVQKRMAVPVLGDPPVLPQLGTWAWGDCTIGFSCVLSVRVFSGGVPPFTYAATGLPSGMEIRSGVGLSPYSTGPIDGEIIGTPTQPGFFDVTVTATDADGLATTNTFPLHVVALYLTNGFPSATFGAPYSFTYRIIGGPTRPIGNGPAVSDYRTLHTLQQTSGLLPFDLALNPTTFTISGTPQETGYPSFASLRFTDLAGGTLDTWFSPFIQGPNGSTIQINTFYDLGTSFVGGSFSRTLTTCCVPSYAWALVGGALPPGLALSGDGVLSGVTTTAGTSDFLVRVSDATFSANQALRRFRLVVLAAPSTLNMSSPFPVPFGNVGTLYSLPLSVSGGSAPYAWTIVPNSYPPPGVGISVTGATTASITGIPTSAGQFSFSARVTDAVGNTVTRFFSVSIYPPGVTPPLNMSLSTTFTLSAPGQISIALAPTSGLPPYHFSLTPGATPVPGMRIQEGPPLPNGFTAPAGFIGVIATSGVFTTSIRVTDSAGHTIDRATTITVNSLWFTPEAVTPPKGAVGQPYSFRLTPAGGSGNYSVTLASFSVMPAGLAVDSSGLISGTPTTAGSSFPNFVLTDLSTSKTVTIGISFTIDPFAITTSALLLNGTIGSNYSQAFSAPGCDTGCTWSQVNVFGLTMSSAGVLSGVPTSSGSTTFTLGVNGSAGSVQKQFALSIIGNPPSTLTILTGGVGPTTVGGFAQTQLSASGGLPPYTWSLHSGDSLPPGVVLVPSGEVVGGFLAPVGYLLGRPRQVGTYTFTLDLADSNGATTSRTVTWNVSALANLYFNLPLAGSSLVFGSPYTQPLLFVGGTGSYTFSAVGAMPSGLTLNPATGLVSGTPTVTGSVTTAIEATDTAGNALRSSINFNIGSGTPVALVFNTGPNLGTVATGSFPNFNVTPTGGTPPYAVTATTALPPGFALISGDTALGTFAAGTFLLAGPATVSGTYTFTLRAQDSAGNIGARTFTLVVASFAVLTTNLPDASRGTPYSYFLHNFGAPGGAGWFPTGSLPAGLVLSPDGEIAGTPTQAGTFTFGVITGDVTGATLQLNLTLRVSAITIVETALNQAVVGIPYSQTLTATGGSGTIVWSAVGLPSGLTMSASGTISGTPGTGGGFLVQVTATDGVSPVLRRFVLYSRLQNPTVLDLATSATVLPDATVGQLMSVSITPSGGVPPYSWDLAPGSIPPPGIDGLVGSEVPPIFYPASLVLTGVPSVAGIYAFDLVLTDSTGAQAIRTFTLKVSAMTILGGAPRTGTVGVAYAQQFTGAAGTAPYTFTMSPVSATQDMLPPGYALSSTGLLSGTTTSTGNYAFLLQSRDSAGNTFVRRYALTVNNAAGVRVTNFNPADTSVGSGRSTFTLTTSGFSTYAWSLVSGSMPSGVALSVAGTTTSLIGAPSSSGTYTFTLRATDNANGTNTADHAFTYRVAPFQIVSPPTQLVLASLPSGRVGNPYSHTFKVAGGAPPQTFAVSPFVPLPLGIQLSADGVLSGIPQQVGNYAIALVITDAAGRVYAANSIPLPVTISGTAPLLGGFFLAHDATVGVPFNVGLDSVLRGGTPPYSWALVGSSSLPSGLKFLPGSNGVEPHIGGLPTTAGSFTTAVIATDSAGQTVTGNITIRVSALALSPETLPQPRVGIPYAATLIPSGGTAPYVIEVQPSSDMPPGLSVNASGVVSGTPTDAGNFLVQIGLKDSAGAALLRLYRITLDNAAGQAPAVRLAPRPIQAYYEVGSAAPAPINVDVSSTSGALPFTLAVSGVPGATLGSGAGTTQGSTTLNFNTAGLTPGTYVGILGVNAPSSANLFDAVPVTLTVTPQPPCQYTVNPTSGSAPFGGSDGSFNIQTGPTCAWTATASDATWIRITSPASGTGSRALNYTILPSVSIQQRNGSITVNGQVYSIAQFGISCSFAIQPSHILATAATGQATVNITASGATCAWTASGLNVTPVGGTGSGSVTVTVPPNPAPGSRTLSATIANQLLSVDQTGISCSASLSPYSASSPAAGGQGGVQVTTPAGCAYGTVSGPSWISVTSGASGTGSGPLVYSVEPNSRTETRSGSLTIGGQTFQLSQDALPCSVTLDASALGSPHGAAGGAGTVALTTNGANCSWTASSQVPWASLSRQSGTGNATIGVTVSSNVSSTTQRSGSLIINGQTVNISQGGTVCTYELRSTIGSVSATGGNGAVGTIAPAACTWSAVANDNWLAITSSGTGGSADVNFSVLANPIASPRSGTLTIAGLTYTVNQAGAPCSYTLPIGSTSVASGGIGSGSFGFSTAFTGCSPSAVSFANWITVQPISFSGSSGTVTYAVAANPSNTTRAGTIQVGDRNFTITQLGGPCGFSLNAYSALFGPAGGSGNVLGSQSALGCTPVSATDQPSFILLGSLTGPNSNIFTLPYGVTPLSALTSSVRIGRIDFGGRIVVVKQTSY